MNYRRSSQAAEWAVVAAVVGLHVLIHVQSQEQPATWWLQAAADAQPLVVMTLLVAWAVLGPGWRWARLTMASLVGWMFLALAVSEPYRTNVEIPWYFALAAALACVLAPARLCGLKVTSLQAEERAGNMQFSIRSLLVITTLVALAIGGLQLLRPAIASHEPELTDFRVWLIEFERLAMFGRVEVVRGLVPTPASLRQFVLVAAVAASALGALAAVLRPGAVWLRMAILAIAIPSGAAYLAHLTGGGGVWTGASAADLTVAFAAVATLTAVSVLPLRLFGFRLHRNALRSPTFHVGQNCRSDRPSGACPMEELSVHPAHTECGPTLP